ncbi:hypothetical protein [Paraglaciecola chathamensis]|uniref:Lipoprotein n=1 Tax=Paraglaciecola chathamensis S18K6 TaxID=1127672 RepID=A0AAV3V4Y2_9ALTE|nr:hypothetical protein [Paraglaciecola chathamensis]GAC11777.1 hypothetical protein GCHA_3847 [Paraglaciecola chathamensis S18K6]
MTMKKLLPLTLLVPIVLSACAGKPKPQPKEPDMFATNIKDTNRKVFNFSISANQDKGDNKPERGGAGGPPPEHRNKNQAKGDTPNESPLDELFTHLETKLSDTGYCREGYTEIDTYESSCRLHILGACNEVATPEDKRQFANNYGY